MRRILAAAPTMRVLVLSGRGDGECVERLRRLGALGSVTKRAGFEHLAAAIRAVWRGETCFAPFDRGSPIPQRRRNAGAAIDAARGLLHLIALSMANKRMAARLGISIKTVGKHRQSLMTKLDIHDVAGLTRYPIEVGRIEVANGNAIA